MTNGHICYGTCHAENTCCHNNRHMHINACIVQALHLDVHRANLYIVHEITFIVVVLRFSYLHSQKRQKSRSAFTTVSHVLCNRSKTQLSCCIISKSYIITCQTNTYSPTAKMILINYVQNVLLLGLLYLCSQRYQHQ